jgi:NADPH-dependent ferric siderophore reductase
VSTRARQFSAQVLRREQISDHLVRIVLGGPELSGFETSGVPDEWVGLVVPGQYQSRYYTVRGWDGAQLSLDVVVHDTGLVTSWVVGDPVGDQVSVSEPRGSFSPPAEAAWVHLVGDLTALPAIARIAEGLRGGPPLRVWAETEDDLSGYLPPDVDVTWLRPPAPGASRLAEVVDSIAWPAGEGYFWMAGESAQMRAIRRLLLRERHGTAYDVMGYWRAPVGGLRRDVDPAPIVRAGRAAGWTPAQIWAAYDAARDGRAGTAADQGR